MRRRVVVTGMGCVTPLGTNIDTMIAANLLFEGDLPRIQPVRQSSGADSGDGTVPLWSAVLPGALRRNQRPFTG